MEQNFEQNIPLAYLLIGFLILLGFSFYIKKTTNKWALLHSGQVPIPKGSNKIPSIEERIAANKSWASGQIRSKGYLLVIVLWTLTIVWNICFGVAFFKSFSNPDIKTAGLIALGVFSVLGIVPLFFALRFTTRQFRYGESTCRILGKAGVLGNPISGTIQTSRDIDPTSDYVIEMQCIETFVSGPKNNRKTTTTSHWQEKQTVSRIGKRSSTGIPFSFSLPTIAPETACQTTRGDVNWQIRISAQTEGIDYAAMFIVPVFKMN